MPRYRLIAAVRPTSRFTFAAMRTSLLLSLSLSLSLCSHASADETLRRIRPQIAYCLHETSCISAWAIESDFKVCKRCAESSQECTNLRLLIAQGQCETRAFWEIGRYSKQNKKTFSSIMGISPGKNLYNHTRIAMLTNDGTRFTSLNAKGRQRTD